MRDQPPITPETTGDALLLSLSTLGFVGRSPVMPGTCGSAVAVLLAPLLFLPLSWPVQLAVLAGMFLLGGWAATRVERMSARHDPSMVVIDEVVGQWLALLPLAATASWPWLAAGFVFFRALDIAKPWPVRRSEHWLPEGFGVMLDDVLAGAGAAGLLWAARAMLA
ncbi:phosphatidylglycerophosphatase A family protein [Desulfohalovibrio reitneri]|uniref:phosphatidylglycerophosphatase A family protein n=1 Tax=Desulfohalovibrio reitneri TaxID=1307759 RepID=UPI0005529F7E|nr:phosphatidylglycerophosphatase A [Desulfohalovibrio reitneri]